AHRPAPACPVPPRPAARPRVGLGHEKSVAEDWNKPFRSVSLGTEDFVPVIRERCESRARPARPREDRMSSAVVTRSADRETTSTGVASAAGGKSGKWRWVAFVAVITAAVMDMLDSTITQVAAPTIRSELGGSYAVIEWVTAAYALAMAVGLLTGGRLGDVFGRRRVLLTRMGGVVLTSAACRAAQGAGGRLPAPAPP